MLNLNVTLTYAIPGSPSTFKAGPYTLTDTQLQAMADTWQAGKTTADLIPLFAPANARIVVRFDHLIHVEAMPAGS